MDPLPPLSSLTPPTPHPLHRLASPSGCLSENESCCATEITGSGFLLKARLGVWPVVFNHTRVLCEGVSAEAAAAQPAQAIIWVNDFSEHQRRNLHFASWPLPPRRCHSHQESLPFYCSCLLLFIFLFSCSSGRLTWHRDNGLIAHQHAICELAQHLLTGVTNEFSIWSNAIGIFFVRRYFGPISGSAAAAASSRGR